MPAGFLWKRMDEAQFPVHDGGPRQILKSEAEDTAIAAEAAGGRIQASAISREATNRLRSLHG